MSDLTDLAAQAKALANDVGGLSLAVDQLGRRTTRGEKVTALVVVGLTLDIILSIALAITLTNLFALQDRETQTRQQALCPLYKLLSQSQNPRAREAYAAGPQAYDDAFRILNGAYDALDCPGR